jgi:hypothetical protein
LGFVQEVDKQLAALEIFSSRFEICRMFLHILRQSDFHKWKCLFKRLRRVKFLSVAASKRLIE